MREILRFLQWLWRRQETWQKWFIVGMFFVGATISAEGIAQQILALIPIAIFGFYLTKWALWDGTRAAWNRYKEERNSLLTTIKDSDK